MSIADTIAPRSDQLNADDLLAGPRTFTITAVRVVPGEQPVEIDLAEFPGRPWKPGKSMRRVLVHAWGPNEQTYTGRRVTLYNDPDITFGPDKTGGIRVSHMSHIDRRITMPLTVKRGKRAPFTVDKLPDAPPTKPAEQPLAQRIDSLISWYGGKFAVTPDRLVARIGRPPSEWTEDDLATLRTIGSDLAKLATDPDAEFPEAAL